MKSSFDCVNKDKYNSRCQYYTYFQENKQVVGEHIVTRMHEISINHCKEFSQKSITCKRKEDFFSIIESYLTLIKLS